MTTTPLRAATYSRVSRDEQAKNFSLPTQRDANRAHCVGRGYDLVAEFSEDFTGTEIHRPEMDKLLALVHTGAVDVVVVYVTDRLTRGGPSHLGWFMTTFAKRGVTLERVGKDSDESPEGQLFGMLEAYAGQKQVQATREASGRGLRAKARAGKPLGCARPPFGLRYVAPQFDAHGDPIKSTVRAAYEPDPDTHPWLLRMFALADAGSSLRQIGFDLEAAWVAPPYADRTGAKTWWPSTVRDILTNRAYIGEGVAFKVKVRRMDGRGKNGGKGIVATPRAIAEPGTDDTDKALRLPDGVFPRCIDPARFERVQRRILHKAADKSESQRRDRNPDFGLLRRGIVRCPTCRGAMMVNPGANGGAQYRCDPKQRRRHGCPSSAIRVESLDADVWTWVQAIRLDPRGAAALVERLRGVEGDHGLAAAHLSAVDTRTTDISARLETLLTNLERATGETADAIMERINALVSEREGLASERAAFSARADDAERQRERTERAIATVEGIPGDLDGLGFHERQRVLRDLGVTVWLYPPSAEFRWFLTMGFGTTRADSADGILRVWSEDDEGRSAARVYWETRPRPEGFTADPFAEENVSRRSAHSRPPG